MSSSATSTIPTNKLSSASNTTNYAQSPSAVSIDTSSKRSNSSGSFGAAASTRTAPQARNNQPLRKQHKTRKPRLGNEDELAEVAAMKSINSRKGQTSITHLMNFSLPPRPQPQHHYHPGNHRYQRRNPTWGLGSGYHAIDKARYVHANYRFIVRPDQEYHAQAVDADIHLSWDSVLQILASAETQGASCPICLSTPVAPRMAKCGHIFCLPCLIRYMHSSDDTIPMPEKKARWKKCPICEDSIYVSETRPVRWFEGQEATHLREGGDVVLRLLRREPGSTLALPRDTAESYGRRDDIPWFHVAEMTDYARFMKGGEDYMIEQYNKEITELDAQEKEDELMFGDEITWTRKAVVAIEDAKQKIKGLGNPPAIDQNSKDKQLREHTIPESWEDEASHPRSPTLQRSTLSDTMSTLSIKTASSLHNRTTRPRAGSGRQTSHPFYFYHALPNFFLSPLDIRILKAAFGDFDSFPSSILPRVEHISTGHVIDDDLRKRAKYMAHLPYGCEVSFLECDWTDIISPIVLEQFHDDIVRRRKRNHEKEAREERDRLRAEKEEDEQRWAAAKRKRPSFIEKSFSETDFQPLMHPNSASGSLTGESALATTPPWGIPRTQSSFATLASPGTSPDAPRTVWGTTAVTPSSPSMLPLLEKAPMADDGWLQGWEKDLLDDSDAVAMVEAHLNGDAAASSSSSSRPVGVINPAARKGKKKKITLMSTNVRRGA